MNNVDDFQKRTIEKLDRIQEVNDKQSEDISDIKITMARNTISLEEHMRRTTMLEQQIVPLVRRSNMLDGVLKFLGLLALFSSIAAAVSRLLGK